MSGDREDEKIDVKANKSVKKRSVAYRVLVFRVENVSDSYRREDILKASLFIKIRAGIEDRKIEEKKVR